MLPPVQKRPRPEPVLTVAAMRAAEEALMANGQSARDLMEIAGQRAADWIWRIAGPSRICILCGTGNNGGDGYVIARVLAERGADVEVVAVGPPRSEAAQLACGDWTGAVLAPRHARPTPVFVDCLFGSGLNRAMDQALADLVTGLSMPARLRIAIDVPSGVDSDTGQCLGAAVQFTHTLALGAWKMAHFTRPAAQLMGQMELVDIGIAPDAAMPLRNSRPYFPAPGAQAHKYRRGLVCVIQGAMPGAARLSARAAQGAGAGYVKLLVGASSHMAMADDLVSEACASTEELAALLTDRRIGALCIGPGLGRTAQAHALLETALASNHALLLDADALHLLTPDMLAGHPAPIAVTPHQGEYAALAKAWALTGWDNLAPWQQAQALAERIGAAVLLKGSNSVIAAPDGRLKLADTASSWLSVAGSGDVLSGIICARMAAGLAPFDALAQGQWLHARAALWAGSGFSAVHLANQVHKALNESLMR